MPAATQTGTGSALRLHDEPVRMAGGPWKRRMLGKAPNQTRAVGGGGGGRGGRTL